MSSSYQEELEMKQKYKNMAATAETPLEKLRAICLSRGVTGIKTLGRTFRIMDDDRSRNLSYEEFDKGMHDYGVTLSDEEIQDLFQQFDADGSGSISFNEFLIELRPPMNPRRIELIEKAFRKLDKSGDGVVTCEDLKGVYNAREHPKYKNGELTEKEVYELFMKTFEQDVDAKITKEEFMNYYIGVSASIDGDPYFDLMMRNAWKL